ncbi:MAG: BspA family leucine-rich repeat surface protein [Bacteroidales bacterium]|nr:BspA family leucine-rich repeat surface protein [Bacteroidales bacterium]
MKRFFLILALAVAAVGCTKVDEGSVPVKLNEIQVSSKDNTRTEMSTPDGKTFYHNWVKGDAFALMDGARFIKYELQGEGGSTDEVFTGEAPVGPGPYYVYYPYKETIMDIYTDATIKSTFAWVFPSEVDYTGGNIAGEDAMIGLSIDGKKVSMKNMCGYIRLNIITPSVSFLKTLEITAPGGEAIAGPYHVDLTPEGIPELTLLESYNNEVPSNKVTVNFPDKIMTVVGTELFIPLPAIELSEGLTFVLKGNFDGEPEIVLSSSTATLERNVVVVMPDYAMPTQEAQIGETIYETVGEAFDAANASDEDVTIKLLRSCAAAKMLTLGSAGSGDVTLDLNGKTLVTSSTYAVVVDGRNLTVTDNVSDPTYVGGISSASGNTSRYVVYVQNGGNLDWEKGNMRADGYRCLYVTSDATATLHDGEFNSPGQIALALGSSGKKLEVVGDIKVNTGASNSVYLWGGEAYLSAGHYYNTSGALLYITGSAGRAYVSGGYYSSGNINPIASGSGIAYVTGGYYNKAVQSIYTFDPDGNRYGNEVNDDSEAEEFPFKVVPITEPVATGVRGNYVWDYASFDAAALNATLTLGANTVTLQKDIDAASTATFGNKSYAMTLDLNGRKVNSSVTPAIEVPNGSNLTILDSSEDENGEIETSARLAVSVAGTLNVNGGSFVSANTAVGVSGGTLKVLKGHFYGASADVAGSGDITLSSGFFKNKPDAAMIEEDNAAISTSESFNGRTYNWEIKRNYTVMKSGTAFNTAIKSLANGSSVTSRAYQDAAVRKIVFKVEQDLASLSGGVDISTLGDGSVIAAFDGGVVTVSTNYPIIRTGAEISYMFCDFRELTEVEGWELVDTRDVTNARNLVYCALKLERINISRMKTGNITNMTSMFCDAPALVQEVFDFTNWDTGNATAMNYMFDSVTVTTLDLSSFNTAKVTTMNSMFRNCFNLKNVNLGSFNTASVKNMAYMFNHCDELETLDLSNFNTANDTTMAYMFGNNPKLKNLNISSFRTANVQNMNNMFRSCSSLESLDLKNFNTSKVTLFLSMFYDCSALKSIDLSNATTDAVNPEGTNDGYISNAFNYMFYGCKSLETLDLRNFAYKKAGYQHMFEGCVNMKELHLDVFGDISKYRYVNDYNLSVGSDTANTLLGQNATANSPCVIYTDDALLIRLLMFNRNYNNTGQYMNYGYAIRSWCKNGKIVFKKTGFSKPWTFTDDFNFSAAPTLDQIVAPTE